ncbi:AraC family transcriptional regulator [Paractinoplanes abujensis]|uniref:AraC family transcriptional regulator n=1 Tax=Paractinoplanes abujensis TaxID=882441 RepID=A0A7W7CRW6_9ACTN|nr:AraC family transcriptional regulator [Actinoplanes abujensis]MBB4693600.1 AraC family transcriptional regulator [Actinoplanes abujensis]GID21741.1 AraC family transcriptional regulator [Actinoplanes abujensis]
MQNFGQDLPAQLLATSAGLGWQTVEARQYADPAVADEFSTGSDRLLLVLVTGGRYRIESRSGRSWRRAGYRPGSLGVTAPGNVSVLRWRSSHPDPMESLHLHLDPAPAGGVVFPDALTLHDPFVLSGARALGAALRSGAPGLYADSVAQALVTHLAYGVVRPRRAAPKAVVPLSESEVRRVEEHMRARIADDVTVDELARAANVSKYHFIRAFAAATGLTPYRYLRRLRMRAAAETLRTTAYGVARVAAMSGYRSTGQFAAAFRTEMGVSPVEFRNSR